MYLTPYPANGEIGLLNNRIAGDPQFRSDEPYVLMSTSELQRDLELERRKALTIQDSLKEREKEYQKLKVHHSRHHFYMTFHRLINSQSQHDKIKRKALLQPSTIGQENMRGMPIPAESNVIPKVPTGFAVPSSTAVDMNAVVGGMEASGVCVTIC